MAVAITKIVLFKLRSKLVYILFSFYFLTLVVSNLQAQNIPENTSETSTDSLKIKRKNTTNGLAAQVQYTAEDSIINKGKRVFLHKNAKINYENVELTADYIEINWETNTVIAIGVPDSTGYVENHPSFSENGKSYNAERIEYNFNSKKGKIKALNTQEGEGYLKGNDVKKIGDKTLYLKQGIYTTCEDENPHYYIGAKRLKVIPGEKVITGPANLVIQDIPTPLLVPFGYFPLSDGRSSGILVPTIGFSEALGYNFTNGGYYFSISDHLDVSLRGDIFTKGSWRSEMFTRYNKRYKYNGSLKINYADLTQGEEGQEDFIQNKDFAIRWEHFQDPKANPYSRFTALVNAGSQTYYQNNSFNPSEQFSNTLSSSVTYQRSWNQNTYNLNVGLSHNQNLNTNTVDITLPDITLSTRSFYPLKGAGNSTNIWYEQMRVVPVLQVKNEISTVDSLLFTADAQDKFRNGARLDVPINMPISLGNGLTLTPEVKYSSILYTKRFEKNYVAGAENTVQTDTINDINHLYDISSSVSISYQPTIYGLFQFQNSRIKAIRHVITPSISYTYTPDLGINDLRYYDTVQTDEEGNSQLYSEYENSIFGTPGNTGTNAKGVITFGLGNNLEMKVRTPNDTLKTEKKIKLLERLNINSSYNLDAEEFALGNFTFFGSTKISKDLNIRFDGTLDPYALEINEETGNYVRVNKFMWDENKKLARLTRASLALGTSFNPNASKEITSDQVAQSDLDVLNRNPEAFVDFNIPWDLRLDYKLVYSKPLDENTVDQTVNFNGNVNLTPKWKIGFRSGYNFTDKEIAFTDINIYRDLHCWEMRFDWIPFGFRRQYNFTIAVKASVLQDLKLNRTRNFFDL